MSDRFGKYIVESEVGRGGFGRVYRAFDNDMQRRIAIKEVVSDEDPDLLSRFQAEASTTASLTHENIVTVYEYGQYNGRPYLVMEFLEGQTLQDLIASRPHLPLLEKVEVMRQIAEGLHYAHKHGVIHRDVKPGNIMVLPDNKVKIMDFGIARLLNSAAARKTREGELIGAVLYMAPEAFRKQEADKQTDIFAYGTVYYEFLTGEHPFHSKDLHSAVNRIIHDEPIPLSRNLPGCPYALELLLQGLMMKDRETRYSDLADVLFDTEPILRQLREERAVALADECAQLFESGDYDALHPHVKQILSLDPANSQALFWKGRIRERVNRKRAEKKTQQGADHMSALRYRDAVVCFEEALHLGAERSDITARLREARGAVERINQAAQLVAAARAERQAGRLEKAFRTLAEAVELDPTNHDAGQLIESVQREMRDVQVTMHLSECRDLRREGKYREALALLDELDEEAEGRSEVIAARKEIAEESKEAERQKRRSQFREKLQSGRQLLRQLSLERAIEVAAELCLQYPEEREALDFCNEVQRQSEKHLQSQNYTRILERVLDDGRQKIEAGKSAEAVNFLETIAFEYQHEKRFQALLLEAKNALTHQEERAKTFQEAYERLLNEREQALTTAYRQISEFTRSGHFTAAYAALDQLTNKYGESLGAQALRIEVEAARERKTRQQAVMEILARASEAVAQEKVRVALQILDEGHRRYPESEELRHELSRILSSQNKPVNKPSMRDEEIANGIRKAAAAAQTGDFPEAVNILEPLAKRYPNSSELRRSLEAAKRELKYRRAGSRRHAEHGLREVVDLFSEGKVSGAFSWLKGLVNYRK